MAVLSDAIRRDTRANQPAATAVSPGTLYYVTDENVTERSSGAAWEDCTDSSGGSLATLSDVDLTGLSDGDSLVYDNGSGLWLPGSGGGGSTIQYPQLKPGSPTDDFDGASLGGGYTSHSSQGSFATTDCITQARDGSHLRMMFTAQMGALYVSHANGDFDFRAGGIRPFGQLDGATQTLFGIAGLNSSGTGVATTIFNDNNAYVHNITAWQAGTSLASLSGYGHNLYGASEYWLRLTRVTNTWAGYVSLNGRSWISIGGGSGTITLDRLAIGMFYNTGVAYTGALECDWIDVT